MLRASWVLGSVAFNPHNPEAASGILPMTGLGNPRPKEATLLLWTHEERTRPGSQWPVTEEPAGSLMPPHPHLGGGQEKVRATPID